MASRFVFRQQPAAVLRFSGDDHAEFLQNQGTADLRGAPGLCRYSLWLDHRGRIHGDAFVLKPDAAHMLLVSYATPAALLQAKFERHIIADDVEIEDLTGAHVLYSATDDAAGELLERAGISRPAGHGFSAANGVFCFHGRRIGPCLDFLVPREADPFEAAAEAASRRAEGMRIAAGIPLVPVDTGSGDDALNPVEAGLASAVSFDKGCYLGQEVVARAHRLQRASRRLVRFTGTGRPDTHPCELTDQGALVGRLCSVVENPDNFSAIGWLKSRYDYGPHQFDGQELTVEPLPANA